MLRELLLDYNALRVLPYELGKLFNLQNLGEFKCFLTSIIETGGLFSGLLGRPLEVEIWIKIDDYDVFIIFYYNVKFIYCKFRNYCVHF